MSVVTIRVTQGDNWANFEIPKCKFLDITDLYDVSDEDIHIPNCNGIDLFYYKERQIFDKVACHSATGEIIRLRLIISVKTPLAGSYDDPSVVIHSISYFGDGLRSDDDLGYCAVYHIDDIICENLDRLCICCDYD